MFDRHRRAAYWRNTCRGSVGFVRLLRANPIVLAKRSLYGAAKLWGHRKEIYPPSIVEETGSQRLVRVVLVLALQQVAGHALDVQNVLAPDLAQPAEVSCDTDAIAGHHATVLTAIVLE